MENWWGDFKGSPRPTLFHTPTSKGPSMTRKWWRTSVLEGCPRHCLVGQAGEERDVVNGSSLLLNHQPTFYPVVTFKNLSPHHVRSADFVGGWYTPLGILTAFPVYKDILWVRDYFRGRSAQETLWTGEFSGLHSHPCKPSFPPRLTLGSRRVLSVWPVVLGRGGRQSQPVAEWATAEPSVWRGWHRVVGRLMVVRTSLVVQWLRLLAPKAGDPSSIPGQGTKIPHATTKTWCSQIN